MSQQVQGNSSLKEGSLGGVLGIVFFVVAAAAPLAASVATAPVVFGFGGVGAPLAYLIVGVVLLLFSVGYAYMSGKVTSAAGLAAYVEVALGKRAASACAFVAVLSYGVFVMGLYGGFGFFASFALDSTLGISADWFVCATLAWLLVGFMGHRAVDLNMRVLGVLIVLEISVLFFFDVATVGKGGEDGISFAGFDPSAISGGTGFGIALLFAAVAFLGFEATAIYGEEARSPPRRTVAVATYGGGGADHGLLRLDDVVLRQRLRQRQGARPGGFESGWVRTRGDAGVPGSVEYRRAHRAGPDELLRSPARPPQHPVAIRDVAGACGWTALPAGRHP